MLCNGSASLHHNRDASSRVVAPQCCRGSGVGRGEGGGRRYDLGGFQGPDADSTLGGSGRIMPLKMIQRLIMSYLGPQNGLFDEEAWVRRTPKNPGFVAVAFVHTF